MARARSGQTWSAERYTRNSAFVVRFGEQLIDDLAPRPGERILDLGCGDGALTQKIIARGAEVTGVDAGADMVAAARKRGIDARVMDARSLNFNAVFDAVFSHAALHWVKEPDAVLAGVRRALKPAGRFVGDMGGAGNIAREVAALGAALDRRGYDPEAGNPWYFPTAEAYRGRLEANGFTIDDIRLFERPTPIDGELGDWLETFTESYLNLVPEAERDEIKTEVVAALRPDLADDEGRWTLDYVRLRFRAHV